MLLDTSTPRRMRLGPRGDRREQRPGLEAAVLGRAVGVDEVVDQPGVIEAELLGLEELVEDLRPSVLLRLAEEQPEARVVGAVMRSPPLVRRLITAAAPG